MGTVLHLPFNDDAMVPGLIVDRSPFGHAITSFGVTLSSLQSVFGGASGSFNGASYITVPVSFGFNLFGSLNSWTIQFRVFFRSVANSPHLITIGSAETYRLTLYVQSGVLVLWTKTNTSNYGVRISGPSVLLSKWYHVALVGFGGSMYLYVEGSSYGSTNTTILPLGNLSVAVGMQPYGGFSGDYFNGFIDDLSVDNGTALYTSNFTPPDAMTYNKSVPLGCRTGDLLRKYKAMPPVRNLASRIPSFSAARDIYDGGNGRVVGTVKRVNSPINLPLSRRVRLHKSRDGRPLRETWSSLAGDYEFSYIDPTQIYYTVSFDHLGNYRGVIADNLTPEIM